MLNYWTTHFLDTEKLGNIDSFNDTHYEDLKKSCMLHKGY